MSELTVEQITELRKDPDSFRDYLRHITGREVTSPEPTPAVAAATDPGYRITHAGGWPIGTAATGPTPTHGRCTCAKCEQAAVVELPTSREREEDAA